MREVLDSRFFVVHYAARDEKTLTMTRSKLSRLRREKRGVIPSIVVVETTNFVCREGGRDRAMQHLKTLEYSGLEIAPLSMAVAREAGLLKCTHRSLPIADCIVAATALRERACVVSDDPHFSQVRGLRVVWIEE